MYGLSEEDKYKTCEKVEKSREYIKTYGIDFNGKFIPYAVLTKNAWHNSNRYIAELQNRAYSIVAHAKDRGLVNLFITLTLPSEYHKTKTLKNGKVIPNPKFINDLAHTPRAGSRVLSSYWKSILDLRPLKDLANDNRCYFRVTEPHKNGTPHLHISLFIPKDSIERVLNSIFLKYDDPEIKKSRLDISCQYIPSDYSQFYDRALKKMLYKKNKTDKFGVTTLIKNPLSYLMKYVFKTLDDLRSGDDNITDLTLWYIKHGICRFYTSRTLIPLQYFRKINYIEKFQNIYEATKYYNSGQLRISGTKKSIDFLSVDENGEIVEDNIWTKRDFDPNFNKMRVEAKPKPILIKREKIIPVEIDGEEFILKNGLLKKPVTIHPAPSQMKNKQLYDYYYSLDIEDENISLLHYGITQNEMIKRGLLDMPLQNLNDFNLEMEIAL